MPTRGRPPKKTFASAYKSANLVSKYVKKKKPNKKNVVAKSFAQAYYKMLPNKEIRFNLEDLAMFTNGTIADRSTYYFLDAIAQGTQNNQRQQSAVHMSYIHIRGTLQNNSNVKTKFVRMMIVRERNNGDFVSATMANLLRGTGTAILAPTGVQTDGKVTINRDSYIPIYDKIYKVPIESEGAVVVKENIRINKRILYPRNNAAAFSPIHGQLVFIALLFDGDNTTTASTVTMGLEARVFFKDAKFSGNIVY